MKKIFGLAAAGAFAVGMVAQSGYADGDFTIDVNVTGMTEGGFIQLDLGQGNKAEVTGIGWQVTIEAIDTAWLSDATFFFGSGFDPADPDPDDAELFLTPGVGDDFAGKEKYSGFVKLDDADLPNIQLEDGLLDIGFTAFGFPAFVQEGDPYDSFLTIQYNVLPAPGAIALLGMAGLVGVSRRRRAS
jgi:hypothetical protein